MNATKRSPQFSLCETVLTSLLPKLSSWKVVLASASPRRFEILTSVGLNPIVMPSTFDEDLDKAAHVAAPGGYALATCYEKAKEVFTKVSTDESFASSPILLISADTIVVSPDNEILEKAADDADAIRMLQSLNNRTHSTYTGVTMIVRSPAGVVMEKKFIEETKVTFGDLSADQIAGYVSSQDYRGKAGAYGIQSLGGSLISGISGDFYNVMGLPKHQVCRQLLELMTEVGCESPAEAAP